MQEDIDLVKRKLEDEMMEKNQKVELEMNEKIRVRCDTILHWHPVSILT